MLPQGHGHPGKQQSQGFVFEEYRPDHEDIPTITWQKHTQFTGTCKSGTFMRVSVQCVHATDDGTYQIRQG